MDSYYFKIGAVLRRSKKVIDTKPFRGVVAVVKNRKTFIDDTYKFILALHNINDESTTEELFTRLVCTKWSILTSGLNNNWSQFYLLLFQLPSGSMSADRCKSKFKRLKGHDNCFYFKEQTINECRTVIIPYLSVLLFNKTLNLSMINNIGSNSADLFDDVKWKILIEKMSHSDCSVKDVKDASHEFLATKTQDQNLLKITPRLRLIYKFLKDTCFYDGVFEEPSFISVGRETSHIEDDEHPAVTVCCVDTNKEFTGIFNNKFNYFIFLCIVAIKWPSYAHHENLWHGSCEVYRIIVDDSKELDDNLKTSNIIFSLLELLSTSILVPLNLRTLEANGDRYTVKRELSSDGSDDNESKSENKDATNKNNKNTKDLSLNDGCEIEIDKLLKHKKPKLF